jgi:phage gp45-like
MLDFERDIYRNMVFRVELKRILNQDGDKLQQVRATGYKGEELETMRAQQHGLTSCPPEGSLGYGLNINGRRENAFLIGCEHPDHRPTKLKSGESALYDDKGQKVHAQEKGIRVNANKGAHSVVVADNAQHRVQSGGYNIFTVQSLANFRVLDKSSGTWWTPKWDSSSKPPDDPTRD